jgi:peptidylprolyl isomerase
LQLFHHCSAVGIDHNLAKRLGPTAEKTVESYSTQKGDIMEKAVNGKYVSVEYTGTFDNGEVFDSSKGRQPLEVHMGAGQMIPGFEKALLDMGVSEKKTFTLSPDEAYGERDDSNTQSFDRKEIPPGMNPEVGMTVGLTAPNGQQIPAQITEVTDEKVTLDLNHPMAGKSLTFEVEVVGISDAPTQASPCAGGCATGCGTDAGCGCESGGCS